MDAHLMVSTVRTEYSGESFNLHVACILKHKCSIDRQTDGNGLFFYLFCDQLFKEKFQ